MSVCESDSCNHTYALSVSSPCRYYAICCQPLVYRNKMTPMRVALMIGGCWVIPTFISFLPIMQGWNSIGIDHLVSAAGWHLRGRGDLFHKFVEVKAARGDTKTSQRWKKAEQNMFSINRKKNGILGSFVYTKKKCFMRHRGNNNNNSISDTETDGRGCRHHRHRVGLCLSSI